MNYALSAIWHDKSRFIPGVLAVAFSAVLIALQVGLLMGLFTVTSIPIDYSDADIWVGSYRVLSVDLGRPIPISDTSRIAVLPGVDRVEPFLQMFGQWTKPGPGGGSELCLVIGTNIENDSLGVNNKITPEMRTALTEPGGIVVDKSELGRLKITGVGDTAEINRKPVRVVGVINGGFKSLAGPYIFSSFTTARDLLQINTPPDHATYLLVKCTSKEMIPRVVDQLKQYESDMTAFESQEFAYHSKKHWVTKTKAGIAIGYAALLGLLVGLVVTYQTLYAATMASAREYAILFAMGIPRWRVMATVLAQSFWVGLAGAVCAVPFIYMLREVAKLASVIVLLPLWLLLSAGGITLFMAIISGLIALRSVRQIEPMSLLR